LEFILIFIIVLIASVVQSSTGFAFSIVFMSFMPMLFPYKTAILVGLLALIPLTAIVSYKFIKHINIKHLIVPISTMFIGRFIGIYFLMKFSDNIMQIFLGIMLIIFSLYFFFFSDKIQIRKSTKNGIIAGFSSGILGGMTNAGGPPLVLYYISSCDTKEEYSANTQITFLSGAIFSIVLHAIYGNFTFEVLKLSAITPIAVVAGIFIGLKIFTKIEKETLTKAIYVIMIISGISMLIKGILA